MCACEISTFNDGTTSTELKCKRSTNWQSKEKNETEMIEWQIFFFKWFQWDIVWIPKWGIVVCVRIGSLSDQNITKVKWKYFFLIEKSQLSYKIISIIIYSLWLSCVYKWYLNLHLVSQKRWFYILIIFFFFLRHTDDGDDDTKYYVRFALPTTHWLFYCKNFTVVSAHSLYLLRFCFGVFVSMDACICVWLCAHTPAFVQLDEINHPIRVVRSVACFFSHLLWLNAIEHTTKHVKRIFFCLFVLMSHMHPFTEQEVRRERKYKQQTHTRCV